MKKIAITGTMGSGKTFLLNIIKKMGHETFNSDVEVQKLLSHNQKIRGYIKEFYPDSVRGGKVNKDVLSQKLFKKNKFQEYEKLVHAQLKKIKEGFVKTHSNKDLIFFEVPLLFEKKLEKEYDVIILADSSTEDIEKRVLERSVEGCKNKIQKLRSMQIPNNDKKKFVDFIIDCSASKDRIVTQVKKVIKKCEK
ncbi:MAG: dephospho-CoA kinase [Rickettsiales bacterium]